MSSSSQVKVAVRVRPLLTKERSQSKSQTLTDFSSNALSFKGTQFTYDHVFSSTFTQTDLYAETAAPMLRPFLDGYNVTIMAYGQTGSGKTYTMGTNDISLQSNEDELGLIPRFVTDLFANITTNDPTKSCVSISFLEIYGEDVYDLMNEDRIAITNARSSLSVREDIKGGVFIEGLKEIPVTCALEALKALSDGSKTRITASTAMNAGSSRSHAVYKIKYKKNNKYFNIQFIDLAGTERSYNANINLINKNSYINMSLLSLKLLSFIIL